MSFREILQSERCWRLELEEQKLLQFQLKWGSEIEVIENLWCRNEVNL